MGAKEKVIPTFFYNNKFPTMDFYMKIGENKIFITNSVHECSEKARGLIIHYYSYLAFIPSLEEIVFENDKMNFLDFPETQIIDCKEKIKFKYASNFGGTSYYFDASEINENIRKHYASDSMEETAKDELIFHIRQMFGLNFTPEEINFVWDKTL